MPDSGQLLLRSNRKHPDSKRHKLVWFITAQDRKSLQRVIKTTGTSLVPSTEHQWHQWSETSVQSPKDTKRQHPPSHSLFTLLPPDKWYRSICCHTIRLQSSFNLHGMRFLNSSSNYNWNFIILCCTLMIMFIVSLDIVSIGVSCVGVQSTILDINFKLTEWNY